MSKRKKPADINIDLDSILDSLNPGALPPGPGLSAEDEKLGASFDPGTEFKPASSKSSGKGDSSKKPMSIADRFDPVEKPEAKEYDFPIFEPPVPDEDRHAKERDDAIRRVDEKTNAAIHRIEERNADTRRMLSELSDPKETQRGKSASKKKDGLPPLEPPMPDPADMDRLIEERDATVRRMVSEPSDSDLPTGKSGPSPRKRTKPDPVVPESSSKASEKEAKPVSGASIFEKAKARVKEKRSAEHSGKKPNVFDRLKSAFSHAEKEAAADKETGKPSRAKAVFAWMGAHCVANRAKDAFNGFKSSVTGVMDGIAERHGRARYETLMRRFSNDDIMKAADIAQQDADPNERLRKALDVVHEHGIITAGGDDFLKDLASAEHLRAKGYKVEIAQDIPNVHIPDSVKSKLDIDVKINSYNGTPAVESQPIAVQPAVQPEAKTVPIEPKPPVSSLGEDIRSKLGESARDGKLVLDREVEESMQAYTQIAEGLQKLQEIADRDNLPESYKSFMRVFGPRLNEIINEQDNATTESLNKFIQQPQPAADTPVEAKSDPQNAPIHEKPAPAVVSREPSVQRDVPDIPEYDEDDMDELNAQFDDM